jgi:hypothetical protein
MWFHVRIEDEKAKACTGTIVALADLGTEGPPPASLPGNDQRRLVEAGNFLTKIDARETGFRVCMPVRQNDFLSKRKRAARPRLSRHYP